MISVKHFFCMLQIKIIFTVLVPWQINDGLNVLCLNRKIRTLRMKPFKLTKFLFKNFGNFGRHGHSGHSGRPGAGG